MRALPRRFSLQLIDLFAFFEWASSLQLFSYFSGICWPCVHFLLFLHVIGIYKHHESKIHDSLLTYCHPIFLISSTPSDRKSICTKSSTLFSDRREYLCKREEKFGKYLRLMVYIDV
jgi:hypothetical protein